MKNKSHIKRVIISVASVLLCVSSISITVYAIRSKPANGEQKFTIKELADYTGLSCTYTKKVVTEQALEVYISELLYNMNYDSDLHSEYDGDLYGIDVTDEYVKNNLPGYESAEQFRQECKKAMEESYEDENEISKASSVVGMVVENSKFSPIDQKSLEEKETELREEMEERAKEKEYKDIEDYLQKVEGMTYEEYRDTILLPIAENSLKYQLVIDTIKEKENLYLTEEEKEYMRFLYSNSYGTTEEDELNELVEEGREAVEANKVYRFLVKNNTFTPVIKEEKEILDDEEQMD